MVQTSNLFFPRPGKSKRLRLPICFFPAREKAKLLQISNLLFPNPGKSNRKSEEQLFLQRGQVTNMTCADLSQDLREPFATAVRAHSKSAFEIRSLTRKRWVFERRSHGESTHLTVLLNMFQMIHTMRYSLYSKGQVGYAMASWHSSRVHHFMVDCQVATYGIHILENGLVVVFDGVVVGVIVRNMSFIEPHRHMRLRRHSKGVKKKHDAHTQDMRRHAPNERKTRSLRSGRWKETRPRETEGTFRPSSWFPGDELHAAASSQLQWLGKEPVNLGRS